jgi:hypothetical protein
MIVLDPSFAALEELAPGDEITLEFGSWLSDIQEASLGSARDSPPTTDGLALVDGHGVEPALPAAEVSKMIEPLALDEAYLDVTENRKGIETATEIAMEIRARIRAETGLTASAGVSYNKFLEKLASDHRKPDGLFVIAPKMGPAFVEGLPVGKFHGVGPATTAKMNRLGIHTGLDLRAQSMPFLQQHFGKSGAYYAASTTARSSSPTASANPSAPRTRFPSTFHVRRCAGRACADQRQSLAPLRELGNPRPYRDAEDQVRRRPVNHAQPLVTRRDRRAHGAGRDLPGTAEGAVSDDKGHTPPARIHFGIEFGRHSRRRTASARPLRGEPTEARSSPTTSTSFLRSTTSRHACKWAGETAPPTLTLLLGSIFRMQPTRLPRTTSLRSMPGKRVQFDDET